jgi:hypothetical protein
MPLTPKPPAPPASAAHLKRSDFFRVRELDDWGHLRYQVTIGRKTFDVTKALESLARKRAEILVLFPDGAIEEARLVGEGRAETISDMGSSYTVHTTAYRVRLNYRGVSTLIPLPKVFAFFAFKRTPPKDSSGEE